MLIEIFTDTVYEQTVCDPERGIKSKRAPKIIISERGRGDTTKLRDAYIKARDFITVALDNSYYCICSGGKYMLEIEWVRKEENISLSYNTTVGIAENKFSFKFNSLRDTLDDDHSSTIHGEISIDEDLNVVYFSRDRVTRKVDADNTASNDCSPFVQSCHQEEPTDLSEGGDSIDDGSSFELSMNSFSVDQGTIDVSDPNMGIGTVDGSMFSIDEEKQKRQDEFLKNMSRKISKRNNKSTNLK